MANLDAYDAYFRVADLDQDGKISGAEAVAFFKGTNLPQVILSKIWHFSDQSRRGVLSKAEFFNALKLVTVAQSGRELTLEIVRAALFGPASSQIPAPRITSGPSPAPPGGYGVPLQITRPTNPVEQVSQVQGHNSQSQPPETVQTIPVSLQEQSRSGFSIPRISTTGLGVDLQVASKPFSPSLQMQSASGLVASNLELEGGPIATNLQPLSSSMSSQQGSQEAFGGLAFQASAASEAFSSAAFKAPSVVGAAPAISVPTAMTAVVVPNVFPFVSSTKTGAAVNNGSISSDSKANSFPESLFKAITSIGNSGLPTEAKFGPETFSAFSANNEAVVSIQPAAVSAGSSVISQSKSDDLTLFPASVSSAMGKEVQALAPQVSSVKPMPSDLVQPGLVPAPGHGLTGNWPKMTQSDVQRYTRLFTEVDSDRDGKILGEQARDLFLSWKLPREVLKQVWDLSDQDADSMLSLREFCTALYLMERYREGRPLLPVLPSGFHFEDDLHRQQISTGQIVQTAVAQHSAQYNVSAWQQSPGNIQPSSFGAAVLAVAPGLVTQELQNPLTQPTHSLQGDVTESNQMFKSNAPILEMNIVNQLTMDEQEILKSKHKEAEEAENKVRLLEKEILDSQQKMEFYRSKLQEIILFKSRCDNHLAEATERATADKKEVEILVKKYDDKFRQAGEVNSRLIVEEAGFRDIQERKMELYKAIAQIEQGGNNNSLLQTRADRISCDLDELKKAHSTRVKRLGLQSRPLSVEPGFGWQPGMQENSIDWADDWDKFNDEGFTSFQELLDGMTTETATFASTSNINPSWDERELFTDEVDFKADSPENKSVAHFDDAPVPIQVNSDVSPEAKSEAESGKSEIESPQHDSFSPRSHPIGKSILGNSLTAVKASERDENDHEPQEFDGDSTFWPPREFASNSNSGDASDGIRPSWASTFGGHDEETSSDVRASWGLKSNPLPEASLDFDVSEATNSRHRTEPSFISHSFGESLDFVSLRDSSPARPNGVAKHEYDFFGNSGSNKWQDKPVDVLSTGSSVPGTPLFTATSPRKSTSLLGEDFNRGQESFSRLDSFGTVRDRDRLRGLGSFDDSDLFADTGPFRVTSQAPKSSDHWSTF